MPQIAADELLTRIVECPVCQARGATIHHDVRASLVYFCQRCQHEWEIEPAEEPLDVDLTQSPGPLKGDI